MSVQYVPVISQIIKLRRFPSYFPPNKLSQKQPKRGEGFYKHNMILPMASWTLKPAWIFRFCKQPICSKNSSVYLEIFNEV